VIDLHCHYLPFVDDGADSLQEAIALATASSYDGIRHAVLTPHVFPGQWENTASSLAAAFRAFRTMLRTSNLEFDVSLGGEVRLLPESLELAARDELTTLGSWEGGRVQLLELPDAHIPAGTHKAIEFLLARGYRPMIAHPERNKDVMRDPRRILPLVNMGCLLQLTAASVVGQFGPQAHKTALQLLDAGIVTVIASDAHNLEHRPPRMGLARATLEARYGAEAAALLTELNPGRIVGLVPPAAAAESTPAVPEATTQDVLVSDTAPEPGTQASNDSRTFPPEREAATQPVA
jgi:protein-tyrosine phosphatase